MVERKEKETKSRHLYPLLVHDLETQSTGIKKINFIYVNKKVGTPHRRQGKLERQMIDARIILRDVNYEEKLKEMLQEKTRINYLALIDIGMPITYTTEPN